MCNDKKDVILENTNKTKLTKEDIKEIKKLLKEFRKKHKGKITIKDYKNS